MRSRGILALAVFVGVLWTPAVPYEVPANSSDIKTSTDIAVVVNPKNPMEDISLSALKKIILGEQRLWPSKLKVAIALRVSGARERDIVLNQVTHMTDAEFKKSWMSLLFRGEADAEPFSAPSNGASSSFVEVNPGGIAFMPGTDVRLDLKVLKVNGLKPGDPNYPLK